MSLDIRTASIQVQSALVDAIDLAFRRRYPEAATLADLSAVDSEKLPDRALVFVLTEGVVYRLRPLKVRFASRIDFFYLPNLGGNYRPLQ